MATNKTNRIAAAVDIGTNSVKLTVGRREADGTITLLFDDTKITRLGKGVDASGRISDEAATRTLDALAEFGEKARALGAVKIAAVGTSALRDAANGPEVIATAQQRLGGTVEVISGEREAELTYRAARENVTVSGASETKLLVTTDIGGGSTEVVQGNGDTIRYAESLQLGAVRLTERAGFSDTITTAERDTATTIADATIAPVPVPGNGEGAVLVASGGTAANLAGMEQAAAGGPLDFESLHGMTLTHAQIASRIEYLADMPLTKRRTVPGLEPDRADVIVAGALILARLMHHLGLESCRVSLRGLRYGLLYELIDGE